MKREGVLKFVKQHRLAVVSTISAKSKPEAAVVEYGELEDLTIIIDTLKTSRKYKNLQTNKSVAVVIGWDEDKTLQIDGIASELNGQELERAKVAYFSKNDRAKKWESRPDIAYFAINPDWLRYSDVSKSPWQIEEILF